MKKIYVVVNIVFLIAIMTADVFFVNQHLLVYKGIASGLFAAQSVFNVIICARKKVEMKFPCLILAALITAFAADLVIQFSLIIGMLIFGISHVFYFVSYCKLEKFCPKDLIPAAVSIVVLLIIILFAPFLDFKNSIMHTAVCIYAAIISCMVGKALSDAARRRSLLTVSIAVGSILFYTSDFALMLKLFGNFPGMNEVCLYTYYPAQFLLALSPLLYTIKKEKAAE